VSEPVRIEVELRPDLAEFVAESARNNGVW
jgi:hypothetical protein